MNNFFRRNDDTLPLVLLGQGENFRCYDFFGAHFTRRGLSFGVVFRVYAPNALRIFLVGDFNDWNIEEIEMQCIEGYGVYECFVEGLTEGLLYKYYIIGADKEGRYKSDPFAFCTGQHTDNPSIVYDFTQYRWNDKEYLQKRPGDLRGSPVNIYELHLSSWRRSIEDYPYSYTELSEHLIPYVVEMGYTHIELLPVTTHSSGDRCGYGTIGYFAPDPGLGMPDDFMNLVDCAHSAGIGVIIDLPTAYFPKTVNGLYMFDGSPVYEDTNPLRQEHKSEGKMVFNFGKGEVQSFLVSAAMFWLDVYHIDGIRIDNISSMLYLDYGRGEGQWERNYYGKNENLEAVALLQKLNSATAKYFPYAITIAEERTAWQNVTGPPGNGGLGFSFCWYTGWTRDMLFYMSTDSFFRKNSHHKLIQQIRNVYSENYILTISHENVCSGHCSMINKMPGEYNEKFAQLRTFYGYLTAHPGKKMLFMGCEFGQFVEWNNQKELNWMLLDYDKHRELQHYIKNLNIFYKDTKELFECDFETSGFCFVVDDDAEQNIVAFLRQDIKGHSILCISNFAPVTREGYCVGVKDTGCYKEIFTSNEIKFGGTGQKNGGEILTVAGAMHGEQQHISITVPPLTTLFIRLIEPTDTL